MAETYEAVEKERNSLRIRIAELEAELANRVGQVYWKCKEIEGLRQGRDQLQAVVDTAITYVNRGGSSAWEDLRATVKALKQEDV